MKLGFKYGTRFVTFNLTYRNRNSMSIEFEPSGEINVISPLGFTDEEVLMKVKSKASWIIQKQYELKSVNGQKINREAVNGEFFMYLGRHYSLQLVVDENVKDINVKLYRGKFIVATYTKDEEKIKLALENWYREKTLIKAKERIKYYEGYFSDKVSNIKVKEQKKRWASCTSKNELLFNWRCSMAPSNVFDYIVVHEMCHMKYKDHSKEFWDSVKSVLSDYEVRRKWLRDNGIKLDI